MAKKYVIDLIDGDAERVMKPEKYAGNIPDFRRELQRSASQVIGDDGIQKWVISLTDRQIDKIGQLATKESAAARGRDMASGGWQSCFPIRSLRAEEMLPSYLPLLMDEALPPRQLRRRRDSQKPKQSPSLKKSEGPRWVYFKREGTVGEPRKIKIGHSCKERRANSGRSTDNPRFLHTILKVAVEDGKNDFYYHAMFSESRIRKDQEWFWPSDDLMEFIEAKLSEQELQRSGK
jgi:hypothetical protein